MIKESCIIKELHCIPGGRCCIHKNGRKCFYLKTFLGKEKYFWCHIHLETNWSKTEEGMPVRLPICKDDFPNGARVIAVGMK